MAVLAGLLYLGVVEIGGNFARDHLGVVGRYFDWRWSTATTLAALFFLALLAHNWATRDRFDRTGATFKRDNAAQFAIISDGVKWVYRGWLEWPDGRREVEVDEECPDHSMRLLNWNSTSKISEPIRRGYGKTKSSFKGCPGLDEGHVIKLTSSKTLDEARRTAASRLQAKDGSCGVNGPGSL